MLADGAEGRSFSSRRFAGHLPEIETHSLLEARGDDYGESIRRNPSLRYGSAVRHAAAGV